MIDNAIVNGIPLLFVVMGLVAWVKSAGVKDVGLRVASMGIGLVLGFGYMYSTAAPVGFGGWFGYAVYGLALGLLASGVVDAVRPAK